MNVVRTAFIAFAILFCCALANADEQPPITKLQLVLGHPVASNRRIFEGIVYLYVKDNAYFFYPHRVTAAEYEAASIDIMPGEGSDTNELFQHKTGDRLKIKAKIDVDLPCYSDATCVPFRKPIFLNNLKILD